MRGIDHQQADSLLDESRSATMGVDALQCVAYQEPHAKPAAVPNYAGQLLRFVCEMQTGDLVLYPSKQDRTIQFGRIQSGYVYASQFSPGFQNQRTVKMRSTSSAPSISLKLLLLLAKLKDRMVQMDVRMAKQLYPNQKVFERCGFKCAYCCLDGSKEFETWFIAKFSFDRIKPRAHDGPDAPENLVLACHSCNLYKGAADCEAVEQAKEIIRQKKRQARDWDMRFVLRRGTEARLNSTSEPVQPGENILASLR